MGEGGLDDGKQQDNLAAYNEILQEFERLKLEAKRMGSRFFAQTHSNLLDKVIPAPMGDIYVIDSKGLRVAVGSSPYDNSLVRMVTIRPQIVRIPNGGLLTIVSRTFFYLKVITRVLMLVVLLNI